MRYPSDMAPSAREPQVRSGHRGRIVLAVVVGVLVVLAFSVRAIATFWTDYLWFDDLGLSMVWGRLQSAKISLAVVATLGFFLVAWINLLVAERLSAGVPMLSFDDEVLERYQRAVAGRQRMVLFLVALTVAVVPGISAAGEWKNWLLFHYGGDFGIKDPQFGTDIGFYIFKLPFLSQVVDWVFGFLLVTLVLVVALYYLNGSIRLHATGERMASVAKAHLSVLLALLALVKAADYWLQRYELTFAQRDNNFDGAGYTAVNASLPALQLLILVALFAAVLFVINIRRRGWVLPAIAIMLWAITSVVVFGIYPAFVQRFQVEPAELSKEKPFIERNIEGTRAALGLDRVSSNKLDYEPNMTREKLAAQQANLDEARLLDPNEIQQTIQTLEFGRAYYRFDDVDVDRYAVGEAAAGADTTAGAGDTAAGTGDAPAGDREPTIISARELNLPGVTGGRTWEKLHLVFTHGYAAAVAPANRANSRGEPDFLVKGIPTKSTDFPALTKPETYVGENMDGYAIVGTRQKELSSDNVVAEYDGDTGVPINSFLRKAAFSLRFWQIDPLISDLLTDDSKIIYNRNVLERVHAVAPYLLLDQDIYPVVHDGRIVYVVDAYTTSSNYPYAEAQDLGSIDPPQKGTFNYVRNSVKAVVDGYDGKVSLYLVDTLYGHKDPIARAWAAAFPDLFAEDMPADIAEHLRYPEMLFKAQTQAWGRYHQTNPSNFFNNTDAWSIAQDPPKDASAVQATSQATDVDGNAVARSGVPTFARIDPYYQMMQLTPGGPTQFVLTRPYVLASEDDAARNLTSVMIAHNDPGSYGKLEEVVVSGPGGSRVDGPLQAAEKISTYQPVSQYQTVVGQRGSKVQFGNMLILPFGNSLLYVRPVYARQENSGLNTLQRVAVTSGNQVGFGESLSAALDDMFNTDENGQPVTGSGGGTTPTTPTTTVPPGTGTTAPAGSDPDQLLAEADAAFGRADTALAAGDLGEYQRQVREARRLLQQASAALSAQKGQASSGGGTPATGETPSTTAPPSTAGET